MKNILIVDDNNFVLEAIALNFSCLMPDCTIVTANGGRQAIEICEAMRIDFILTDIEMPAINGYQLIEQVRKTHPSMPILVMTGCRTPEAVGRLRALGVADCIEKPFDFTQVIQRISETLEPVPVLR